MQTYLFQVHIDQVRLGDDGRAFEVAEDVIGDAMPDDDGDYGDHPPGVLRSGEEQRGSRREARQRDRRCA